MKKNWIYVKGFVQIGDAKNIEFSLKLNLSKEFLKDQSVTIGNAKAKDPISY